MASRYSKSYWEKIEAMLDALDSLPAAERESYLARVCPDEALRREVLALAAVEDEASVYLDRFAEELEPKRDLPADLAGRCIGAYRLLKLLGRGGMGVVYEAERVDGGFEQRVALKLLTTSLTGSEAHRRFLAERRILASLDHPAIARIFDGGVTEDGTPWFAMERVEGVRIDVYCDHRRLRIRQRLALFVQVCDAVEHAHRRLVVHRDLKPANVLVADSTGRQAGEENGRHATVKLLDFGIAKLLDTGDDGTAPVTRTSLRLMTPEYASPEQIRGKAVTTSSDVYQLGLLLYELLTGHRPYTLKHHSAGELERAICEQPPTRLSAAITRDDTLKPGPNSQLQTICHARGTSPIRLRRRLRGDLEKIVLKALSKEPERRYGSADRLAEDIRRHLQELPVTARADTWRYRGRKFLRRHAVAAAAASVALALAAGMTGFHMARIQTERDVAQVERDRAEAEAVRAEQMSRFLVDLFRNADPREARGIELTARELLDLGAERVDRELAQQPETQARILQVLGRTYLELGFYQPAEELLARTLELQRERHGPEHPEVATVLGDYGLLRYHQGEYEQALELLTQARRLLEAASDHEALAEVLGALGQTYRSLGRYDRSRATLEQALALRLDAENEDAISIAVIFNMLGLVLTETGAYDQAEDLYERALATHERELGPDHPMVGIALTNLAIVRGMRSKSEDVEAMYRRAIDILENAYGPRHPRVAAALSNLGHFLTASHKHDQAVEVLQQALEIQTAAVDADHPDITYPLSSLGDAYYAAGGFQQARNSYRQSAAIRERALAARRFDPLLMHNLVRLGRVETELGDNQAGTRYFERALSLWRRAPDTVDPQLAPSLFELGHWLAERQRCAEAETLLRRAHQLHPVQPVPDDPVAACPNS